MSSLRQATDCRRRLAGECRQQPCPGPRAGVALTDRCHWRWPGDRQVWVVISHGEILGWIMRPINSVTHIGKLGERQEPMEQARWHVEMPELLVVEQERLVLAEGRRVRASVDEDIEHRAVCAADELCLAVPGTTMEPTQHTLARTRLRVLRERRAVNPVLGSDTGVERASEEPAVVAMQRWNEDHDAVKRCRLDQHRAILAATHRKER